MGASKIDNFTPAQIHLAMYAKALGHPARIAIVQFLAQRKSCVCREIVNALPLSQSTISQHLRELKNAGLIRGNIDGPSVWYCVDEKIWNRAKRALGNLFENCDPANVLNRFPEPQKSMNV
ncbi:MAG TPA: metalloregulator ArsR/SmtB family transcription factor [Ohtaekwangia sp.]|uniref:ArsR/SmtB family transcription factor n=1 Tax=Ohtaekwangia sp. TaxID=2066019 RepID=UPI002F94342C